MRALFVTWDGGGNEATAIAAAEELLHRAHDVLMLGYETQRRRLSGRGLDFRPLRRASTEFSTEPWPKPMPAIVMASEAQLVDVREALALEAPDVVVADCLLFGALATLESAAEPTVVLVHSPAGLLVPRGGLLDRVLLGDVNRLRGSVSLPEVPTLRSAWPVGPARCRGPRSGTRGRPGARRGNRDCGRASPGSRAGSPRSSLRSSCPTTAADDRRGLRRCWRSRRGRSGRSSVGMTGGMVAGARWSTREGAEHPEWLVNVTHVLTRCLVLRAGIRARPRRVRHRDRSSPLPATRGVRRKRVGRTSSPTGRAIRRVRIPP